MADRRRSGGKIENGEDDILEQTILTLIIKYSSNGFPTMRLSVTRQNIHHNQARTFPTQIHISLKENKTHGTNIIFT